MGNSIDKIDDGLYICGVQALADIDRLKSLGITHILNAAYMELYRHSSGGSLTMLTDLFTVKCLECDDAEDCNLSVHFEDLADFIEQGRKQGGVVVHCAAGISRASTSSCAYLMIKQNLSLDAAFHKVHSVRNCVHPNDGFWRQLRDLEAVLKLKGRNLQPLELPPESEEAAVPADGDSFEKRLADLNRCSGGFTSFATHFLTARLELDDADVADSLAHRLKTNDSPGVVWQDILKEGGTVLNVRAKVVPSMDAEAFKALLTSLPGVKSAHCEQSVQHKPP